MSGISAGLIQGCLEPTLTPQTILSTAQLTGIGEPRRSDPFPANSHLKQFGVRPFLVLKRSGHGGAWQALQSGEIG